MQLTFQAIDEPAPGVKWKALFQQFWPAYHRWWLSQGETSRPTYLECRKALRKHMPELMPLYNRLADLAGGSDHAARFLSCYSPPPYLAGCSQAIWPGPEPLLVRNYDYSPQAFEGVVLRTHWLGQRVLGLSDCLVGLLDGVNEEGLAVSLTFGGRREVGPGFGIPLVLRYVLETCANVEEAIRTLKRIPCHMAYNVTVLDRTRAFRTVFLHPDRRAIVTEAAAATNHQQQVEWRDHARATSSIEREAFLLQRLERRVGPPGRFVAAFQRPPLYSPGFEHGYGTLYTAAYRPAAGALELHWPGLRWDQSLDDFNEGTRNIVYRESSAG
ncbi:MAG: C45 family autoproteolytic acyltransferase/hydrolase [Lysobacterales bacterium]